MVGQPYFPSSVPSISIFQPAPTHGVSPLSLPVPGGLGKAAHRISKVIRVLKIIVILFIDTL